MNVLGYVIYKCCFMLSEDQSPEEIETFIKSNKNQILFILDGYDEIVERGTQSRHLNDFLDRIKNQTYVLMTSRPLAIDALGQSKIIFDRKLENIGFINKNIEAYVRYFMREAKKPDQTEPMLKFLKTHPSIWGIAHIPINLELLSWLWSEGDLELVKGEIKTLSKLYQTIVARVQDAYVRKSNPLYAKSLDASVENKEEEPFFSNLVNEFLEYLAYESMQQESLLIPKSQL
ncbi:MAG: family NTPase, partial [Gammaproteobacteria bacterium]|nr:family NTPase [Gammaproteobacteria bacterium]